MKLRVKKRGKVNIVRVAGRMLDTIGEQPPYPTVFGELLASGERMFLLDYRSASGFEPADVSEVLKVLVEVRKHKGVVKCLVNKDGYDHQMFKTLPQLAEILEYFHDEEEALRSFEW